MGIDLAEGSEAAPEPTAVSSATTSTTASAQQTEVARAAVAAQSSAQQATADATVSPDAVNLSQTQAAHASIQSAEATSTPGTAKIESVKRSSSTAATASASTDTSATAVEVRIVAAQNATADSTGVVREMAAARTEQGMGHSTDSSASGRSTGNSAQETFAALDSSSAQPSTVWVHAGTRQAEAGYQDPNLGWVGVRAEVSGGTVHASIVPSSASAAESLGQHMTGLNNYLNDQHTPVGSLSMSSPDGQGSSGAGAQSSGQNANSADSSAQQETGSAASARVSSVNSSSTSSESFAYSSTTGEGRLISLVA